MLIRTTGGLVGNHFHRGALESLKRRSCQPDRCWRKAFGKRTRHFSRERKVEGLVAAKGVQASTARRRGPKGWGFPTLAHSRIQTKGERGGKKQKGTIRRRGAGSQYMGKENSRDAGSDRQTRPVPHQSASSTEVTRANAVDKSNRA